MLKIAVIGGGYTGLSTVLHLQRSGNTALQLVLFDGSGTGGRGVAYAPAAASALLNVPAGRMGALAEAPDGFFTWLAAQGHVYAPADYVPRRLYGDYLRHLLTQAQAAPGALRVETAEVTGLRVLPEGLELRWNSGQSALFDRVVLALGNFPPAPLPLATPDFYADPRYFGNPWEAACLRGLDPDQPVLLLGTSLTMVDTALALRAQGQRAPLWVLSPRGRLPQAADASLLPPPALELPPGLSLAEILREARQGLAGLAPHGSPSDADWQALAVALRPHFPTLWSGLTLREQARFLRHLRHPWGQIRHRLPPQVAAELQEAVASGALRVLAGRLQAVTETPAGLVAHYLPRGSAQLKPIQGLSRVINCTGPNQDYARIDTPLLRDLRAQGLIQPHPLKLGLLADASGALLDAQGRVSERLFTLGPALRGLWWESTAVGEIRTQAARLAARLHSLPLNPQMQ
ncbi:MAG: FAD/NAD(P)-binding protein [Candidatus Sericytochromatia bacterium]